MINNYLAENIEGSSIFRRRKIYKPNAVLQQWALMKVLMINWEMVNKNQWRNPCQKRTLQNLVIIISILPKDRLTLQSEVKKSLFKIGVMNLTRNILNE